MDFSICILVNYTTKDLMPYTFACTLIFVQIEFKMCQIQGGAQLFLSFCYRTIFQARNVESDSKRISRSIKVNFPFESYAVGDNSSNWLDFFLDGPLAVTVAILYLRPAGDHFMIRSLIRPINFTCNSCFTQQTRSTLISLIPQVPPLLPAAIK